MHRSATFLTLLIASAGTAAASAFPQPVQPATRPQAQNPRPGAPATPLKRVEPGVADSNPLRVSHRQLQHELRLPTGFQNVYEIDPSNGANPAARRFVRQNGAIFAVFPRSIYRATEFGISAPVPPGTIFYIGALPPELTRHLRPLQPGGPAPATLVRADPRNDTTSAASLHAGPAAGGRAILARPRRPGDPADPSLNHAASLDQPPRVWHPLPSGPGIMTDEAERRRAVEHVMSQLLHAPAPADPPASRRPAAPAPHEPSDSRPAQLAPVAPLSSAPASAPPDVTPRPPRS